MQVNYIDRRSNKNLCILQSGICREPEKKGWLDLRRRFHTTGSTLDYWCDRPSDKSRFIISRLRLTPFN